MGNAATHEDQGAAGPPQAATESLAGQEASADVYSSGDGQESWALVSSTGMQVKGKSSFAGTS